MDINENMELNNNLGAPQPVRPVLIADEFFINQYGDVLGHILSGLNSEGITTALVYPPNFNIDSLIAPTTEKILYPTFKLPFCGQYNNSLLYSNLTKFKPTVVHSLCGSTEKLADRIADKFGIKYIVNADFLNHLPWAGHRCQAVVSPCNSISDKLNAHRKYNDKIKQINFSTFVEEDISCFKSPRLTSITAVSMFENYGVFEPLLSAIRHLAIDGYEFVFLIIGSGRNEQKVRKLIRQLGLSHIVNIVPIIHPLRTVFSEADIYIHFEPADCFPSYLLEALSAGMAAAVCKMNFQELVIKNQTAVVFDGSDELNIYSTISDIFDKKEFARNLAKNSQEHLRKNYSVSVMIEKLTNIYRQANANNS